MTIVSPKTVAEGNSGETTFNIVIALQTSSVALGREVVYTVELTAGTATGYYNFYNLYFNVVHYYILF